jgi:2-methylcitrate dehydratase PrpD
VAVAALDGVVNVRQVHSPDRIHGEDVRLMRQRVELLPDDEYEAVWPRERPTRIRISTYSGETYETVVHDAIGSYRRPMTDNEIHEKFATATGDVIGDGEIAELLSVMSDFETVEHVTALGRLLRAAGGSGE